MRARRQLISAMMAVGVLPLAAAPASAAPPGNDEPQGAVVLHLGDRVEQDTSEATTNAQDAALNEGCGAPATNASVWYTYSPDVDRTVVLDMTASDYSGGMLVFEGTPTADSVVTCGPGAVALHVQAGQTYNVMVISDTDVNGGQLVLSLENAPPPPRVHVSVARRGVAFRGGAARIHGSYFCAHGDGAFVYGTLFQRAGRLKIQGEFGKDVRCDGSRHRWSARVVSPVGTYARGRAVGTVHISGCGLISCHEDRARRRIHLAWAAGSRHRLQQPTARPAERPRPLIEQQGRWPGSS